MLTRRQKQMQNIAEALNPTHHIPVRHSPQPPLPEKNPEIDQLRLRVSNAEAKALDHYNENRELRAKLAALQQENDQLKGKIVPTQRIQSQSDYRGAPQVDANYILSLKKQLEELSAKHAKLASDYVELELKVDSPEFKQRERLYRRTELNFIEASNELIVVKTQLEEAVKLIPKTRKKKRPTHTEESKKLMSDRRKEFWEKQKDL